MEDKEIEALLVDEELSPVITEKEGIALKEIVTDFVKGYAQNQDKPMKEWLRQKMQGKSSGKNTGGDTEHDRWYSFCRGSDGKEAAVFG